MFLIILRTKQIHHTRSGLRELQKEAAGGRVLLERGPLASMHFPTSTCRTATLRARENWIWVNLAGKR